MPEKELKMLDSDLVLNLVCLDKGIIQLSDLESAEKQFATLRPVEKRLVARKLRSWVVTVSVAVRPRQRFVLFRLEPL